MKRNPVFHIAMAMYSLIYFVPLLWMALSALKSNAEIAKNPLSLPTSWDFSVFSEAFTVGGLGKYAINSAIVTSTCTSAVLLFGSMAAFAFTRLKFRFSKQILALITLGLILPLQSYFIAQNALFDAMGIKDTQRALLFIQAITDASTKRIEGGHDAEAEIKSATAFCIAGLSSI